jgi:beta-galactosidase/beta-glucuronidase
MRSIFVCCFCLLVLNCAVSAVERIDLSGRWNFSLDRDNVGINEQWYSKQPPQKINLPGSLQEQGFGDKPSLNTQWTSRIGVTLFKDPRFTEYIRSDDFKCPFWLTPERHYVGKAWYQREVDIPGDWQDKRIVLSLERPHWKTTVWVDNQQVGSSDSLGTAHEYDLANFVKPANKHNLTICVDNNYVIPVGQDAHSISDQTQSNWNGIAGKILLICDSRIWIDDVQIYPNVVQKRIKVDVQLGNLTGREGKGVLTVSAESFNTTETHKVPAKNIPVEWNKENGKVSFEYDMGGGCLLWDEYRTALYRLTLSVKTESAETVKHVQFGMRELGIKDKQFTINGRKIFLRGTLECCIFPQHGYPPTDVEEWKRIIRIAKSYGLNHFRFHSWCPPEAAFAAADEEGFYLQVEGSCWAGFGNDTPLDKWIYEEIDRMIKAYGNHPSFCFLSPSNEPSGKNRDQFLGQLLQSLESKDNRRFYVAGAGWPQIKENQYSIESAVRLQNWKTLKFNRPPQTYDDYREHVTARPGPVVGHEVGQWCAYPDLQEDKYYTGVLKAKNIEIFRDKLQKAGMGNLGRQFLMASGKFQSLLYKQEIETALRTANFAGFQLLDLHDFPGQGTAPVGVLNALWQSKGYITAEQYRRFCNDIVPLARMKKRIFTNDTSFEAVIDVANYSAADVSGAELVWKITKEDGTQIKTGKLNVAVLPTGGITGAGSIEYNLSDVKEPARLNLEVKLVGTLYINDWDFWVYPATLPLINTGDIYVAMGLDEQVAAKLNSGAKVLLLFPPSTAGSDTVGSFQPIFWNRITFPQNKIHTVGILCDANHPAMAKFPTDFYAGWQWQDLLDHSQPLILDKLPKEIAPIIQPIDDWNNCRKLGLLFEAWVGTGKILVCSIDVQTGLDTRLTARQLRHSLLAYMISDKFSPKTKLNFEDIEGLFKDSRRKNTTLQ